MRGWRMPEGNQDPMPPCCHRRRVASDMKPLPSQIEALDPDFRDVTVEDDTDIHQVSMTTIAGLRCRWEWWTWRYEGVGGESLVFRAADVAHLSDTELERIIRSAPDTVIRIVNQPTIARKADSAFVFFNYNFRVDGDLVREG